MDCHIRDAAEECKSAFNRCCSHDTFGQSWVRAAQGNFNLWCAELKVTSLDDKSTLDYRLRKKDNIRNIVRDLLRGLSDALNKCLRLIDTISELEEEEQREEQVIINFGDEGKGHVHGPDDQDTAQQAQLGDGHQSPLSWEAISDETTNGSLNSESENGQGEPSRLSEQARYIRTIIDQLMRSSLVIREAGNKYRFQEADAKFDAEAHSDFRRHLTAVILTAFPGADTENLTAADRVERSMNSQRRLNEIQTRLVHANMLRRNRIEWNTRNRPLAPLTGSKMWPTEAEHVQKQSNIVVEIEPTVSQHINRQNETPSIMGFVPRATSQAAKATTKSLVSARTATDVGSQLTGRHIFPRRPSSTTTQMTSNAAKQTYPRHPLPAVDGSLRCPYCNKVLPIEFANAQNQEKWSMHIVHDVVPYTCIAEGCEAPDEMYLTSETLLAHMLAKHSVEQWTCDYCNENNLRFDTAEQWEEHIAFKHPSIVPADNRATFARLNRKAMIGPLDCPLCPYAMHDMDTNIDEHILLHLHEFALKSLPGRANGEGEPVSDLSQVSGPMSHTQEYTTEDHETPVYPAYQQEDVQIILDRDWKNFEGSIDTPGVARPPRGNYIASESWQAHAQVVVEVLDVSVFLRSVHIDDSKNIRLELRDRALEAIDQMREISLSRPLRNFVAVDFGTTYSGIAWGSAHEPEKHNVVDHWGEGTRIAAKAPTVLYYDNGGSTGSFKWGFGAKKELARGHKVHEWFKLGLYPEYEKRRAAASDLNWKHNSLFALPPLATVGDYERLTVDYLKGIKDHVDEQFAQVNEQFADVPRNYIITVPVIWDHEEQNRIRICAERAGLGRGDQLQLVSEPEATAVWALKRMMGLKLEVGDTFVVCDAGGLTVDLASYTIEALEPEIKLAGAAKGSDELCGSSYLNRIFRKHLQDRMKGYHGGWDQKYLDVAVEKFETTIKVEFTGNDNDDHSVYMPSLSDSRRYGVKDGSLVLRSKELKEVVFDPVIGRIQRLVEDQISNTLKPVKRVLLAGGFGQSAYLKQQLELVPMIQHKGIFVEHIDQSETSIMRGALEIGFTRHRQMQEVGRRVPRPRIVSRISPKSWGACILQPPVIASDRLRANLQSPGRYLVERMQWFIQEKSAIRDSVPIVFEFYYERSVYDGPIGEIMIDIYEFTRPLASDSSPLPRYPDEPGVKKFLTVLMDLTGMNVPIETHNDQLLYVAKFEILVVLESASLSFSGRYNGKEFPAKSLIFI